MKRENKKGGEIRPLEFLTAKSQTETDYSPSFFQSMGRDELHELMMEVFLCGYLRSDGNFRPLTSQELLSLYRCKIKEVQNFHSPEKLSTMLRFILRCILDPLRRFRFNLKRRPLFSAGHASLDSPEL